MVRAGGGCAPRRGGPQIRTAAFGRTPEPAGGQNGAPGAGGDWSEAGPARARGRAGDARRSLVEAAPRGGRLLAIEGAPGIGKIGPDRGGEGARPGRRDAGARCDGAPSWSARSRSASCGSSSSRCSPRCRRTSGRSCSPAPPRSPRRCSTPPSSPPSRPGDSSLAMLHGLYWLTANVAAREPLLLAIDDLHWCDLPSLRWMAYLLPRMEGLALSVVVGLRPEEAGRGSGPARPDRLRPAGGRDPARSPDAAGAARLLRETLSPDADDAFCAACREETGGNPLLLRELGHAIAADGLAPTEGNVPRLRELAARAGSRAVALRLSRLPPEATALAQGRRDPWRRRRSPPGGRAGRPGRAGRLRGGRGARAGRRPATAAAARVRASHDRRGRLRRAHAQLERDAGHARAARLLADAGAEPERVAAHLLRSSAGGPVRWSSRRCATPRAGAGTRGASESAVAYLRRALEEPPPAAERAELLLELGSAEALVNGEAAVEHLRAARELIDDPVRKAETALLLGRQLFLLRGEEADAVLTQALDDLDGADAELERLLEARLITNDLFAPVAPPPCAPSGSSASRTTGPPTTFGEKVLLSLLAYHDARAGGRRPRSSRSRAGRSPRGRSSRDDVSGAAFVPPATVLAMADLDEVLPIYEDALAEAHRRGSTLAFVAVKVFRAAGARVAGRPRRGGAEAREALAAGPRLGADRPLLGARAAFLADALMEQGGLDDAAAALARVGFRRVLAGQRAPALSPRQPRAAAHPARGSGRRRRGAARSRPPLRGGRQPQPRLHRVALPGRARPAPARPRRTRPAGWRQKRSSSRAPGALRGRSAAALRAAGLVEGGERRACALLEEAVEVVASSPGASSSTRRRAPSSERRSGGPTAAPRRASTFGRQSSWRRSAAPRALAARAETRAARHRRAAAAHRPERRRVAHAERAARRRDGRRGADQPRDRAGALRHPEDGRGPPHEHLPEARDQLALAARCGARRRGAFLTVQRLRFSPGGFHDAGLCASGHDRLRPTRNRRKPC